MTPEQLAEQWLLSPVGGQWQRKPDGTSSAESLNAWVDEMKSYCAGYAADRWIPVSQPPEESGRYWCYVSDVNDLGVSHYQWNCAYTKHNNSWTIDRLEQYGGTVTNWQPLPSPPTK